MKKRWLVVIVSVIVFLFLLIYMLRHVIVAHGFEVSISEKTNQKVVFNIGDVNYHILSNTVSFSNSNLTFSNVFVNSNKTVELSELEFGELQFKNISIIKLLFHQDVIAEKLLISNPSVWFKQKNNPVLFKEKPREVLKTLKQYSGIFGKLKMIFDEIEITHGKLDLNSSSSDIYNYGSVEFMLLLKDFDTSDTVDSTRLLFAKDHFVKLSNFDYRMLNGDSISFDSLVFETCRNDLILFNIVSHINGKSVDSLSKSIDSRINVVRLEGLEFSILRLQNGILIDSVILHDADIVMNENFSPKTFTDTIYPKHANIFEKISDVIINNFHISNASFARVNVEGDTLVQSTGLSFGIGRIEMDSTIKSGIIRNADYSKFFVNSGNTNFFSPSNGFRFRFDNVNFTEKDREVIINNITMFDTAENANLEMQNRVKSLKISGVSASDYHDGKMQSLFIEVDSPNLYISSVGKKKHGDVNFKLENVEIDRIEITKGNLNFISPEMNIKLDDFFLSGENLGLNSLHHVYHTDGKNYKLEIGTVEVKSSKNGDELFLKNIGLANDILETSAIKLNSNSLIHKINLSLQGSKIKGINIPELIDNKILRLKSVGFYQPEIFVEVHADSTHSNKQTVLGLKEIFIENIDVIKGNADFSLYNPNDSIMALTMFDLSFSDFFIDDFSNIEWVKKLNWNIILSNSSVSYNSIPVKFDGLMLDKDAGLLDLKGLSTVPFRQTYFEINNFDVAEIQISGISYNDLLSGNMSDLTNIKVVDPEINLLVNSKHSIEGGYKVNIPHFNIEEFELLNLKLDLQHDNSRSSTHVNVGDVDIMFKNASTKNYITGLKGFSLCDFCITDTTLNNYVKIDSVFFNKEKSQIDIQNIVGGNIFKTEDSAYHNYQAGNLFINGLVIGESYPHSIIVDTVFLKSADIESISVKQDSEKTKKKFCDIEISLPEIISGLSMDYFVANEINYKHKDESLEKDSKLSNLKFEIVGLSIDSVNNKLMDIAESVSVFLQDNKFVSKDSLYDMSLKSVSYNFTKNIITAAGFSYLPRYNSEEFFKKAEFQTDMMTIYIDRIDVSNTDVERLIDKRELFLQSVDVYGLNADLYRNKRYPIKPGTYKKMPREALFSASVPISIDSVVTHNGYVKYREIDKKSIVPGEIFLDNFNLTIKNIRNDSLQLLKNPFLVAKLNARLLSQADLDLTATFQLLSDTNDFWVSGNLSEIDFSGLNSMTQNIVGVTLSSGNGELAIPLISGNSYNSQGKVRFKYEKLKVELYNRENATNASGLSGNMANLILNDIFIKSNNPGFLGKTREGDVYFRRNTEKSVIAYIWKSTMSGLMSTMGYNNKEQRQEKRQFRKMLRDLSKKTIY